MSQAVSESSKFYVLQHLSANLHPNVKILGTSHSLKTSVLLVLLNFSYKKVPILFGQFVESIYLCIRNREGHPLRLHEERVL